MKKLIQIILVGVAVGVTSANVESYIQAEVESRIKGAEVHQPGTLECETHDEPTLGIWVTICNEPGHPSFIDTFGRYEWGGYYYRDLAGIWRWDLAEPICEQE